MTTQQWNRRELILSSGLGASWLVAGCQTFAKTELSQDAGPALLMRKNWVDGDALFKQKYANAVAWFKANDKQTFPPSDPRSYLSWKKLASVHAESCQHMNSLFLPWHRLYLNYFENACRFALQDPTFMLPYWDWTEKSSLPPEFYDLKELASKRNLARDARLPDEFINGKLLKKIVGINDFYAFYSGVSPTVFAQSDMMTSLLEGNCHNAVHTALGGEMLGANAPLDPIFWLHHANLDRIWASWYKLHPSAVLPPDPATGKGARANSLAWLELDLELSFNDKLGKAGAKKSLSKLIPDIPASAYNPLTKARMKVRDLLGSSLGYSYENLAEGPRAKANPGDHNQRNERIIDGISRVEHNVLLSNLTINQETVERLKTLSDEGNHASLLVLNVPIIPDPLVSNRTILRFFAFNAEEMTVNAANELRSAAALQRPDYLGSFNFLLQGHMHHEQVSQGVVHLNLDVTEWLRSRGNYGRMTLLMIALDTGQNHAIVDLFGDIETEMKIQYSTLDS